MEHPKYHKLLPTFVFYILFKWNKLNENYLQISLGYSGASLNPAVFPRTPEHAFIIAIFMNMIMVKAIVMVMIIVMIIVIVIVMINDNSNCHSHDLQ